MSDNEGFIKTISDISSKLSGEVRDFYNFHGVQLVATQFPPVAEKIDELCNTLKTEKFDAGDYFEILENQEDELFEVVAKKDIKANERLFLIDHAFTFRYTDLRTLLKENKKFVPRIQYMLKFWEKKRTLNLKPNESQAQAHYLEFENMEIQNPNFIKAPEDTIGLSFFNNSISDIDLVRTFLQDHPAIKVFWLNNNPVSAAGEGSLLELIQKEFPRIEILNSKFTRNAKQFAVRAASFKMDFLSTNNQNVELFAIDLSGRDFFNIENITEVFSQFDKVKEVDLRDTDILGNPEAQKKFLTLLQSLKSLRHVIVDREALPFVWDLIEKQDLKNLCPTLKRINDTYLDYGMKKEEDEELDKIVKYIWRIANCYRLASTEKLDESACWYIMDELGTSIPHSDQPNVAVIPLLYAPNNKLDENVISYSILWPLKNLNKGQRIGRDYLYGLGEDKFRSERITVWYDVPLQAYNKIFTSHTEFLMKNYSLGRDIMENKKYSAASEQAGVPILNGKKPLNVITDIELVEKYLTLPEFAIVKELELSDIIFLGINFNEEYRKVVGDRYINQFPFESCIVMKHNLAKTVNNALGHVPWLQKTYDLETHLPAFIGEFYERERVHKDNHWIIKPPNLARSMDMVVTNNLDTIIRLMETGPKLAQKYIHRPLKLFGNKIDMRFVVLVRSINPLEVFLYDVFWIRTSNNKFSMDPRSLEIYETHFTVMNYGKKLKQIHYYEFIEEFNKENEKKGIIWKDLYEKVRTMVKELFVAVQKDYPEMQYEKARSVYGMDVMFDEKTYQPKILEMTFTPDCERACKYHPSFFNDIFSCLYLNKNEGCNVDKLF